jgi:hypothetical protein
MQCNNVTFRGTLSRNADENLFVAACYL